MMMGCLVAVGLALASPELEVAGLASVGGNVPLEQATLNVGRLLQAFGVRNVPRVARGLDQPAGLLGAAHVHGDDGLGRIDLPAAASFGSAGVQASACSSMSRSSRPP